VDQKLGQEIQLLHKRICYALGDPKRILLLYALSEGSRCVSELVDALDVPQPTVSRHLGILRERGLVSTERKGTSVYYTLTDQRVIEVLDLLRAILSSQLASEASVTQSLHAG
jgi:ArsR family transcriptional regulator